MAEVAAVAAVGPWVVVGGKVSALLDAGVIEEPELDEGIGMGIFKPSLAQGVEGGDCV